MSDRKQLSRRSFNARLCGVALTPLSCVQIANGMMSWNGQDNTETSNEKKVVCFFLDGGLSHVDSFDPKPDAPVQIRGEFTSIRTSVSGVYFSETWPRLATLADRMTIIRSVHHRHNVHGFALRCMRTLQNNASQHTPALGSVVEWQNQSPLPTYVGLGDHIDYSGALGTNYRPFPLQGPIGSQISRSRQDSNAAKFDDRIRVLSQLNRQSTIKTIDERSKALISQQAKIGEILRSPVYQRMLDTSLFSDTTRLRYGNTKLGEQTLLARNAVNEGMKFTFVNVPGWDMHSNLFAQCRTKVPDVDNAIAAFIEDLEVNGQLDSTIVLVMTEFGRSPTVEGNGRGHWPQAMSILAAGGSIPKGQVLGDTGPKADESNDLRHEPDDLLATIYQWLELDWEIMLPGENARLNTSGTPIPELGLG